MLLYHSSILFAALASRILASLHRPLAAYSAGVPVPIRLPGGSEAKMR